MTALKPELSTQDPRPAFLRVDRSARGFRWVERLAPEHENTAIAIAQTHGVPEILARVLAARGSRPDTVPVDINPTLRALMPDPSTLRDMDKAADRLAAAIADRERIAIFGDYDVDGAVCVALIRRFLAAHGLDGQFYIPDRLLEGYGPSVAAFEQLAGDGASLIVTVDCGTASHEPIDRAHELGVDVLVLDHHQAEERLPHALAVVNPNRLDDVSGQGHLAAAGVVYLFLVAVARTLRAQGWYDEENRQPDLMAWLDMVALATVCDVVPLTGLNRAFVGRGLDVMRMRQNTGLRALADTAGLTAPPNTYHLGFILGPRLNAGGRIGRADLATRLLSCDDEPLAMEIAATLDRLNAERKAMQEALQEEALSQADAALQANPEATVAIVHGDGWHKGLIGLAAARLTERFARPSLVVSWDKDGTGSGSARSIPGADIGSAIRAAVDAGHLVRGGGHAMAAGFTLARDRAPEFFAHVEKSLRDVVIAAGSEPRLKFDGALMASGATAELMDQLDMAGPFGAGNPSPRFAFAAHRCRFAKVVGEKHVRCSLSAGDGGRIDAIAFNSASANLGELLLKSDGLPLHVAGHLRRSDWGGKQKIELHIEDAADPRE